jgi:lysosomal acid lipase/cholesteryl ester hydrolase
MNLCRGYEHQTHYVTTRDGYILALHRLPSTHAESKNARHRQSSGKPVVLLWHGFLMCSEVWVCQTKVNESLAFVLAEAGYDVWLGNARDYKLTQEETSILVSIEP